MVCEKTLDGFIAQGVPDYSNESQLNQKIDDASINRIL